MDRLRVAWVELVDKVKEVIQGEPKSPVELLLDQHLSVDEDVVSFSPKNCTAVAIPTSVMNDFASRTKNIVDYPCIMERIWEILIDHQHDPNLMKKALNLLHYLLINGAIQVLKDCQEHPRITFLESLTEDYNRYEFEQYKFSKHLDIGAGVRKTAGEIHHLLTNERELFHARRQAEKLHDNLSGRGLRSTPMQYSDGHSETRPHRYTESFTLGRDWDDIGGKIITHPDEMFEEPMQILRRNTSARLPRYADHAEDSNHPSPAMTGQQTHARSQQNADRREKKQREDNAGGCNEIRRGLVTESVDLLGLGSLEPVSSASLQVRAQSARLPQKMVATI